MVKLERLHELWAEIATDRTAFTTADIVRYGYLVEAEVRAENGLPRVVRMLGETGHIGQTGQALREPER